MAKIQFIEPTPNPMAFKIKLDQRVTVGGSKNYTKKEEASENPLVAKLFEIHGVESIFIMDDFITINKTAGGIWEYIFSHAQEMILAEKAIVPLQLGEAKTSPIVAPDDFQKLGNEEKLAFINQVIDETIRPGLARDGGGLTVLGLEENVLKVKYQGACGSCPSATGQTLSYISTLLQNRVSPGLTVVPA